MSRSAAYCVLIRDGNSRWFADVWGNLRRELVWGPDALESWLTAGEEIDWDPEDVCGAAIIDFDAQTLAWGEQDTLSPPRARALHHQLLQVAWPNFKIKRLAEHELDTTLYSLLEEESPEEDDQPGLWDDRHETVLEAARYFYPGMDDNEEDEDETPFSEGNTGAWLSIIDQQGKLRQRGLSGVSVDLLSGDKSAVKALAKLDQVMVPHEKYVTEGLWFDLREKSIHYWGPDGPSTVDGLQSNWANWKVHLADRGYLQQCEAIGVPGKPMTDAEALAIFLPQVLSNKRMTMAGMLGVVGGSLKKTAMKATGCLIVVLSIPILLAAFFMNMWKEAGYALITLVVIVAAVFKFIEFKLRSKFRQSGFAEKDEALEEQRPPVAGPLDEPARKQKLDEVLARCGLPPLSQIEPHFEDTAGLF
ncbi:hypothetical protein LOC71_02180 [Rhodopirellula sp. JC740]|uniref:Uncharacterized protein n=1 Tax=Rhodopirellula halodulae TaxID=2894198 RepID=A0ABS8NCD5_9BACT|nr:hypothetical protein [Rhodopirellula sp. JC740]MCC9641064.1 hypothetical protein [Rhodopirellula sp. JC740]